MKVVKSLLDGAADNPVGFPKMFHPARDVTLKCCTGVEFGVSIETVKNGATELSDENEVTPALPDGVAIAPKMLLDPHP
jgi:hypothetical protein